MRIGILRLAALHGRLEKSGPNGLNGYLKFYPNGSPVWERQIGEDLAWNPGHREVDGLAADDRENIYVFGTTESKLGQQKKGGADAYMIKYDHAGDQQGVWQLGTPALDLCQGLAVDADQNMYIAGSTEGSFAGPNKGNSDLFIAAYDHMGTCLWRDQFGTALNDWANDIRLGDNNDVYLYGVTSGSWAKPNNGENDLVVARYSTSGQRLWLRQYGSAGTEIHLSSGSPKQVKCSGHANSELVVTTGSGTWPDLWMDRVTSSQEVVNIRLESVKPSVADIHPKGSSSGLRLSANEIPGQVPAGERLRLSVTTIVTFQALRESTCLVSKTAHSVCFSSVLKENKEPCQE